MKLHKQIIALALSSLLLASLGPAGLLAKSKAQHTCGDKCGSYRWPVKTLTDLDKDNVDFSPQAMSVSELADAPRPKSKPKDSRVSALELRVVKVDAQIIAFFREGDRDVHIILADPNDTTKQIVAEIPNVQCAGACFSKHRSDFKSAREKFVERLGEPGTSRKNISNPVLVHIVGIPFFDKKHKQKGGAPNAIELHPVLDISF